MKISYRILIINFAVVFLIIGSSAIAFYSIMFNVLTSQQGKYLLKSTNEFIYAYREKLQETDDEFLQLKKDKSVFFTSHNLSQENIDFIFKVDDNSGENFSNYAVKEIVYLPEKEISIHEFLDKNPQAIVKTYVSEDGSIYYYGRILSEDLINNISKKISADVALIWNNQPSEISNRIINNKYYHELSEACRVLSSKDNFEVYNNESDNTDLIAALYKTSLPGQNSQFNFLVFTTHSEAADLRSSLKYILIIIGASGVLLSLILTFLFTDKMRKQITQLSQATETTKGGNFKNKIKVTSNDELGKLADAFNNMLDVLEKNQKSKNEYSEFITLINQNPTLSEIADAALYKIIKTCNFNIGALYTYEKENLFLASSYGISKENAFIKNIDLFEPVINNRETLEIKFEENVPIVVTGVLSLEIKYLLILPIIYNGKLIAILELGSVSYPSEDAKEYLSKIQEQLAIGLTNATAVEQLANFVTELKKLNDDYQKQNLQVRQQNETLVELHNELKEKAGELEVQKRKAEESTKLKSQFLASMSHELRTPMNSILGLTELILEENTLKGKNQERLEVVLRSGRRLMNLINEILDLSKIEAGKMDIHEEDVQLDELLYEVENSIKPLLIKKEIDLRIVKNTNTKIIINTDRGKVTQVLLNLLGNSVKFTDKGFVELNISSENDNTLKFEVSDSGIGISEENQKIIFEEFRQIDGTTTRKYSGTGLGLAICKKIAELLKGHISVKSKLGEGSIFTFSIPLKFVGMKEAEDEKNVNVEALIKNRKHPILVIDDDPEVRYTIGQYLTSKGYEVIFAEDGEKGLDLAIQIQPFAITLDVMLPKKDGWNILKELKEEPSTKDIPVILISIIGDKNLGYGLGAFEYFVKPISSEKLISAFDKLESLAKKRIEKIVLVDDDEMEFERFKRAFKDDSITLHYIQDSEVAFGQILEIQPDLIILDLIMPNVDGITLSHKLKSNRETKHIPIIISTAKDISDEEKNSLHDIVENITIKSKGHPLDVLKVLRDRIKMNETFSLGNRRSENNNGAGEKVQEELVIEEAEEMETPIYSEPHKEAIVLGEVMIVDDDPETLFTINEIIESCNCKTILARNGVECIKLLEESTPDLILLDIMMPEMDGFQTIKKIRENGKWANIPVFAVTAKAMMEDKKIILKHGFDDYIPKPVNAGAMAFKVEKIFSKIKMN